MNRHIRKPLESVLGLDIETAERIYKVKFVGDFCLKNRSGSWSSYPAAVFYQPNPQTELGHSHYLGIMDNGERGISLVNGESAFSEPIVGIEADDGEIIYSAFRHDFVVSNDGTVFIDGGRDYIKSSVHGKRVSLVINGDHLEVGEYLGQL